MELEAWLYMLGKRRRGFEVLLVITLSPILWLPEETTGVDEENVVGGSTRL